MRYKAIIQLTSGDEEVIKSTSSQVINLLKAMHHEVDIELVCHGKTIGFVINEEDKASAIITQLLSNGIRIVACMNMLSVNAKTIADLFPGIETVPAGIAELVIKQQEGWSYIKAGF